MSTAATTFLFTDIEGSTRLWERHPQEMSAAVARHDALSREAVQRHGGAVVKMSGDGIHAVFDQPLAAVHAAVDIQLALAQATAGPVIRVRAGIHAGPAEARDGDYFGTTVNRAARLANAANGGQIVLSEAVRRDVAAQLPEPLSLRNLGELRLRDLAGAEPIHQLLHPSLRADFPPLRSLANNPNNLPHVLTTFVGRRKEIGEIDHLFGAARLVTLLGTGGIGKTRLALQSAAYMLDRFEHGVWLVELASLRDEALLLQTLAAALGVKESAGLNLPDALREHLRTRHLLLVLDNCEHLLDACARLADTLLRAAPGLHILATSREGLEIDGEAAYAVPALPLPDPDFASGIAALREIESVRLFLERVALQRPDFQAGEADAALLARIAYRLDGIPLAIELAAARMRGAELLQISAGLDDRFGFLTTGSRVAVPRQKTLKAMIDWSYDLLSAEEKALFARLSVFEGGWSLPAAVEVCTDAEADKARAPELLRNLVDKSLVQVLEPGSEAGAERRYGFLETLRQYAAERQMEGAGTEALGRQHAACYAGFAARADASLQSTVGIGVMQALDREQGNLRAALAWYAARPRFAAEWVALAAALCYYWRMRGAGREGRDVLMHALASGAGTAAHRATAYYGAAVLAYLQADTSAAIEQGSLSRDLYRAAGDTVGEVRASTIVAYASYVRDGYAASLALYRGAIDACEAAGNHAVLGIVLSNFAINACYAGEHAQAREAAARLRTILNRSPDKRAELNLLLYLGLSAEEEGDYTTAHAAFVQLLEGVRAIGEVQREGVALSLLARPCDRLGHVREALDHHLSALRLLHENKLTLELLNGLEAFAEMLATHGEARTACVLCTATAAERQRLSIHAGDQSNRMRALALAPARTALGEVAFDAACRQVRDVEYAIGLALSTELGSDGSSLICRGFPGG